MIHLLANRQVLQNYSTDATLIIDSSKVNVMTTVSIKMERLASGLEAVAKTYSLIGPVKTEFTYEFKKLNNGEFPDLNFTNTTLSPKGFLFPQSEEIIEFSLGELANAEASVKAVEKSYLKRAIIGIRPCDAKANSILQMNFDTSNVKDPYWLKAYNSTTFIGLACNNPCSSCFCTNTGSSPYDTTGLDLLLSPDEKNQFLITIITEKGSAFFEKASWQNLPKVKKHVFEKLKAHAETKISSQFPTNRLKEIESLALHKAPFWDDVSFACINCGACTFVCPTCWCFDIQDETTGNSGIRMKNWDSCMFPIFTTHTTGHNPRKTKTQRVRQRFMHKLKYFVEKYDDGPMCVGCGRCIRSCPVNIDIRQICGLMNSF